MASSLTSLARPTGKNPAGLRAVLFLAELTAFTSIKTPLGEAGTGNSDLVKINGSHLLKALNAWERIEVEINKNELNATLQGAVVGGSHMFEITAFMPGLTKEQQGLLQLFEGRQVMAMIVLADNQVLQLGEENNGAFFAFNNQSGLQESGERGSVITIRSFHQPFFYEGVLRWQDTFPFLPSEMGGEVAGTLYWRGNLSAGTTQRTLYRIWDGTTDNQIHLYYDTDETIKVYVETSGNPELLIEGPQVTGDVQLALSFKANEVRLVEGGTTVETVTTVVIPVTNAVVVGNDATTQIHDYGARKVAQIESALQAITTRPLF